MKTLVQFAVAVLAIAIPFASEAADIAVLRNGYEIRHEQRDVSGSMTRLYLSANRQDGYVEVPTNQIVRFEHDDSVRPQAAATPSPATRQNIDSAVTHAAKKNGIDPDFISSVIHAESSFNPTAVSPKGAQGLMQLMPHTAAQLGVKDSFDPQANVEGGTRYLRELLERYNDDVPKALAAYNAGPARVDQHRGVPPYRETRQYVARIIREFNSKKLREKRLSALKKTEKKKAAPQADAQSAVAQGTSR